MIRILSILLALSLPAYAATNVANSTSYADVAAAVAASTYGDTVSVPAGSSTWSSTLTITKGLSLIGAGRDLTVITSPGEVRLVHFNLDATTVANGHVSRIQGFTFDGGSGVLNTTHYIEFGGSTPTTPYYSAVVSHNRFRNMDGNGFGGTTALYIQGLQCRGVVSSNIFLNCDSPFRYFGADNCTSWDAGLFPFAFGNAGGSNNMFFEGNQMTWTAGFDGYAPGWIEIGQSGRVCVRYNTWDYSTTPRGSGYPSYQSVFDSHGFQNWGAGGGQAGQTGTMISEFYGNAITNLSGTQYIVHRGSWGLFHNCLLVSSTQGALYIQQYTAGFESYYQGCHFSPPNYIDCCDNVANWNGEVNNTYAFNMTKNGVEQQWGYNSSCTQCSPMTENVHYWDLQSGFNGTVGVGRGTQSPVNQWPNPTAGVAYWQCSSPTPTVNPTIIQSGTMWRANSSGQWEAYYTPYVFPHPLSGTNSETYLVATPSILPASGTYQGSVTITMECPTAGADIRYTADRTDPTITSTLYNGSFVLSTNASIYARAFKTGYTNSGVAQNDYVIQSAAAVITPVFSPAVGVFNEITAVTITTATVGAELRYTLDGSIPTAASTLYTGPIIVSTPTTITVVGVKNGLLNSAIVSGLFTVRVAPVVFDPVGGNFTNYVYVGMSSVTTNVSIFYTRDGSTPTSLSTPYLAPVHVTATTTLKAIAIKGGFGSSAVTTDTFTIYGGVNEVGVNQATNATIGTLDYYR